jgi:hypothetical protein
MMATRDWDPAAATAPGSCIGRGSWDPDPPAALGSSVGHESRDPDPLVALGSCGACGSGRSVTSTMLTASEVSAM